MYEPSLISLVSQNTKLIAYELENNKMMLDFSDDILINDVILEEVIYQITESVFENYDVDDILLKVNGSDWVETSKCCGNKFLR